VRFETKIIIGNSTATFKDSRANSEINNYDIDLSETLKLPFLSSSKRSLLDK